jgi:hypothetical protein
VSVSEHDEGVEEFRSCLAAMVSFTSFYMATSASAAWVAQHQSASVTKRRGWPRWGIHPWEAAMHPD